MPRDPTLRTARAGDLPALMALEAAFPGDRLSPRQLRRHLASPRAALRVVVDAGRLLGYALTLFRRGSDWGRLYSLVVDPAARGQGLGGRLLADAERLARRRGAGGLRLEVRQDNAAAIALYGGAGYQCIAALPGYYQDGGSGWRYSRRWRRP